MQVVLVYEVMHMSSDIVLGDGTIDIANNQLIIGGIEVNLCLYSAVSQGEHCLVDSKQQMHLPYISIVEVLWLNVALIIQ